MRRISSQPEVPNRMVILYMVEALQDGVVKGHGFVIRDGFITTRPVLADERGNPLAEERFELRVTDEYFCCINSMVH